MSDDLFNIGDIDPEIASLLGDDASPSPDLPDFNKLFNEPDDDSAKDTESIKADFSKDCFPSIKRWEQEPDPVFFEKDYYTKLITGEGDYSKRLHTQLQRFLRSEDPKERGVFRQRLIPAWWDFARSLTNSYQGSTIEKRWALRFGYILPTLVSLEQRRMLSKVISQNEYDEPIHYVDEWLDLLLEGTVNPLASDELKPSKMDEQTKTKTQLEKIKGSKEANLTMLQNLMSQRNSLETDLVFQVKKLVQHAPHHSIPGIEVGYTTEQRQNFNLMNELLRKLNRLDKDININIGKYKDANTELEKLGNKIQKIGGLNKADKGMMENEMVSIRQMAKLCIGRQGNHLPFLMKSFFSSNINLMGTRENVIQCMEQVEQVDSGIFQRVFRQKTNRIVPHAILLPCYGDKGICWEPFERFNRSTSQGRIAIPMFPKDLKLAVTYALGDLRWALAKEKAAHYWMEEGLTGYYYQWFNSKKMRGDVRLNFLNDYVLWVTKEVNGVQKLDKEVRSIFWRLIPFNQSVKDNLKNQGFVYNELYKKDLNRAMSTGY